MKEQFVHGVNGLIAEDITPEAVAHMIQNLLEQPKLCQQLSDNLMNTSDTNQFDLNQLYNFIEN